MFSIYLSNVFTLGAWTSLTAMLLCLLIGVVEERRMLINLPSSIWRWCVHFWNGGTPKRLRHETRAQDIAEYAVMLAVILVIGIGTVKLIGGGANNVFSSTASSLTSTQ